MKSLNTKELERKESLKIENASRKEFPKITEIDPDERPRKKSKQEEMIEAANLYSPEAKILECPPSLEKTSISLQNLKEISAGIIKEINLAKDRGMTKTSFIIKTKAFDEVEIQITMYDTNPFSYHVRLLGNERIMELSMKHQNILQNQMKEALPRIRLHIATPVLRRKDRFPTKTKKSFEKRGGSCYGAIKRK